MRFAEQTIYLQPLYNSCCCYFEFSARNPVLMAGFFVLFLPDMIRFIVSLIFTATSASAQTFPVELCWDLSHVTMNAQYPGSAIYWQVNGVNYQGSAIILDVTDTGNTPVKISAVDSYGCVADRTVYLNAQYCAVINFPISFTPNGDNVNDVWFPKYAGLIKIQTVDVYSRWGAVVWSGTESGWDGTLPDGSEAPIDVYTFKAAYYRGGVPESMVGSVMLIR